MALETLNSAAPPPKPPQPPIRSPLVHDDNHSLSGNDNFQKRKRSKRSTPPPLLEQDEHIPSSSKDPYDQNYLASILVMLSRGDRRDVTSATASTSKVKYLEAGPRVHGQLSTKPPSAASKKNSYVSALNTSGKFHVCKVCNMSFPSGQALGGHQRRHYVTQADSPQVPRKHENDDSPKVTAATTTTATASGLTSSDGGASSRAQLGIDLKVMPDLKLRLGAMGVDQAGMKSQTSPFDEHEVESPMHTKKPRLLLGAYQPSVVN